MFSLLVGLVCLVFAVLFREWSIDDDLIGDYDNARINGALSLGAVLLAAMFIGIGFWGA